MRNHDPISRRTSLRKFCSFCNSIDFLPAKTPSFCAYLTGEFIGISNLSKIAPDNLSLWQMLDPETFKSFSKDAFQTDGCVLKCHESIYKSYIVLCNRSYDCFYGVVFSCSEDNCTDLDEYYARLVCYKDYLESFSNLLFKHVAKKSVINCFTLCLTGAGFLMKLTSGCKSEKALVCKADVLLDKICQFAKRTSNVKLEVEKTIENNCSVIINDTLFKLLICCSNLCQRKSCDLSYSISTSEKDDKLCLSFSTPCSPQTTRDIYEDAIIYALNASGIYYEICAHQGRHVINIYLEKVSDQEKVVLDNLVHSEYFDGLLDEPGVNELYNMMCCRNSET